MNDLGRFFAYYRLGRYRGLKILLPLLTPILIMLIGCTSVQAQQIRTYYVAAIEVDWDYAPTGINQISGKAFGPTENVFVQNGKERIGKVYRKAVYREYTDATFTTPKARGPRWEHLGVLGPIIRGEVGDTINVVLKNMSSFPVSIHPHGVRYAKSSEGAGYNDGTSGSDKADDAIPPGGTHTHIWEVPERAGPGPMDGSSVLWMYHSHVNPPADMMSGLVGPLIVTRKGYASPDGSPNDIDREFVTLWTIFDENASHYLKQNVTRFTGRPDRVMLRLEDPEFIESNLMHSINGYVYGNLPGLTMNSGERVRWYMLDIGNEVDLHTPHWHGQTVLSMGSRMDMLELLPGSMKTADMVPDDPGTWLLHCHVDDHIIAGMLALFTVTE
ncbi:multicopper oxidase domain-containing protein [Candidatus Methylomirabilis sp.]|uniref:multicopper oxidase domain-containing protein n=1 Tax=Candidatus Methylomirabilis sp. TaxID=2032687 RepID=UPI002A61E386|nr:multicopper oxidase domain-containing protein [Candidatus Methylomirabilis sp.]